MFCLEITASGAMDEVDMASVAFDFVPKHEFPKSICLMNITLLLAYVFRTGCDLLCNDVYSCRDTLKSPCLLEMLIIQSLRYAVIGARTHRLRCGFVSWWNKMEVVVKIESHETCKEIRTYTSPVKPRSVFGSMKANSGCMLKSLLTTSMRPTTRRQWPDVREAMSGYRDDADDDDAAAADDDDDADDGGTYAYVHK